MILTVLVQNSLSMWTCWFLISIPKNNTSPRGQFCRVDLSSNADYANHNCIGREKPHVKCDHFNGLHIGIQSIRTTARNKLRVNPHLFLNDTETGIENYSSWLTVSMGKPPRGSHRHSIIWEAWEKNTFWAIMSVLLKDTTGCTWRRVRVWNGYRVGI